MTAEAVVKCPACGQPDIAPHCGKNAATCRWEKCRIRECSAVFDPARGRGYVMDGSSSRSFTFKAAS